MTEKENSTKQQNNVNTVKKTKTRVQNARKVKQWTNVWIKWLLVWILVFFMVIVWLIFFFFFYLVKHPSVWKWLWITVWTIKNISLIFAWIFFWTFFFLFLFLWLYYLFKLATKPVNRTRNAIFSVIVFILWLFNLLFWFYVFKNIYNIKDENWPATNEVFIAQASISDNNEEKLLPLFSNNSPLIWPIKISFRFNSRIFNQIYLPQIRSVEKWNIKIKKFLLYCWNWQELTFKYMNFSPYKYCLFLKKWEYNVKLVLKYLSSNWQIKDFVFPTKTIEITSNVIFKSKYKLNDEKNEIIWWEVWDDIVLDITKLPPDLWLDKNDILIDFLWNWKFIKYKWQADFVYKEDWLHYVQIKIPDSSYPTYVFPLRILPSTKPICNISYIKKVWKYFIYLNSKSPNWPISSYKYSVVNITTNSVIKKWKKNTFSIKLADWSDYEIKYKIKDIKWEMWECSNIIKLSDRISYDYSLSIKNKYDTISTWSDNIEVIVNKVPMKYSIDIENIVPNTYTDVWFDTDWDWKIDEKWKHLDLKILPKKNKKIYVIVEDKYWNKKVKTIYFNIKLQHLIAVLHSNIYKWEIPLNVKFDASSSYVTTTWDNIAFFNWDFGDWAWNERTRQWVITHTYKKSWKYTAKVTVETDTWIKKTASIEIVAFKPVNTPTVVFPDNLGWQVAKWTPLKIQLTSDWNIKTIKWDFGDWNTFSCGWRECSTITHTYHRKWVFTIIAKLIYLDWSPSTKVYAKINVISASEY